MTSKPYFAPGSEAMLALAGMVDRAGMRNVLWALATICQDKADRLFSDNPASPSGRAWTLDAASLNRIAEVAQT